MRPMTACKTPPSLSLLPYPLFASVKLDGIRCVIKDGVAYSRTLKPIRNQYIQSVLGRPEFNGLDGELIVGEPNASNCMRVTNSGVMSSEGWPVFTYYVFDVWDKPNLKYHERRLTKVYDMHIKILPQYLCNTPADVEYYEKTALDAGYEGLIVRRPDGAYKFGRSTFKEGYLIKIKRYEQEEAVVIGYEPYYHNENEPVINALGYTQRASTQDNKVELPLLGALIVKGYYNGVKSVFSVGTGFTMDERERLWLDKNSLVGKMITYKYFPTGSKDRPRHPVFVSFRDPDDIDA